MIMINMSIGLTSVFMVMVRFTDCQSFQFHIDNDSRIIQKVRKASTVIPKPRLPTFTTKPSSLDGVLIPAIVTVGRILTSGVAAEYAAPAPCTCRCGFSWWTTCAGYPGRERSVRSAFYLKSVSYTFMFYILSQPEYCG